MPNEQTLQFKAITTTEYYSVLVLRTDVQNQGNLRITEY